MNTESEIPVTTVYADEAPGSLVVAPTSAQFHTGVEPEMTAPAPWWNYFIKLMTETNIGAKADVLAILTELNNALTFFGIIPNPASGNQLATGLQNKFSYIPTYDLIIDSNAKLAAWALGSEGGPWESVYIKKGTWTLANVGINLSLAGTKRVVGEPGSKLVFSLNGATNPEPYGLYYEALSYSADHSMEGVTVEMTGTNSFGFHFCENLTNCTGTGTGTGTTGYGFYSCTNLTNCTGTGTGAGGNGSGFHSCTNLTNCTGTGSGTGTGTGATGGFGFYSCTKITNCTGTGTGTGTGGNGAGFRSCIKITNCTGTGTGATGGFGSGFYSCTTLTNCTGTGVGAAGVDVYGFHSCTKITNCNGTGSSYAFFECHGFDFNCSGTSNNKENIHKKYFTGNTPATAGSTVNIAHGLSVSKIISITGGSFYLTSQFLPFGRIRPDGTRIYQITVYANEITLFIEASSVADATVLSKPFTAIIEYYE